MSKSTGGMAITVLRACTRYLPSAPVRAALWHRWIDPYFAWRDHSFVTRTVAGRFAGNTTDILQQYLYYFGVWEPEVTAFLKRRLAPGDGFLDVGANIGYFSLLAARAVGPTGFVVGVEASPTVYERLVANVRRNRAKQVRTFNVAASAKAGRVKLYCGQDGNCGATSIVSEGERAAIAEVAAEPLSALIEPCDWERIRLVKIDVEGAEADVVRGLGSRISEGRADMEYLIEVHPAQLRQIGHSVEDVLNPFKAAGYFAYTMGNDYDAGEYLRRRPPAKPRRLDGAIEYDTNVVLSREDREEL